MFCNRDSHMYGGALLSVVGVSTNMFLLFVIFTSYSMETRGTRTMLTIISLYNIYFSIVIKTVNPVYIFDERGFILMSRTFVDLYAAAKVGLAIFVNGFGQSLSLLMIHCFYRYVKITGKFKAAIETKKGIFCIVICHIFNPFVVEAMVYLTMQPSELRTQFSYAEAKNLLNLSLSSDVYYYGAVYSFPGPQGVEQYNWKMILGTVVVLGILSMLYSTTCIIGIKLYFYVKQSLTSNAARKRQLQLLMLLLAQAISPCIFEFIPAFVVLVGGPTGLIPHTWGFCAPLFFACYSSSDAILVLVLFRVYRVRMLEIFKLKFRPTKGSSRISGSNRSKEYKATDAGSKASKTG